MRFFFKSSCLFVLSFVLFTSVNAYAEPSSANDILHEVMQRSAKIATLTTRFTQEKHVDFLDAPIRTTGFLYFAQHPNKTYSLLWEYNPPAASGIWFNNDTSWMWAQTRNNLRKAQGHESNFMHAMMQQMLFWLQINPQKIATLYELEFVKKHTVTLIPKHTNIFTSITVTFNADLQSLQELTLREGKDTFTTLTFFETKYNIPAIRTFPDGTPLP